MSKQTKAVTAATLLFDRLQGTSLSFYFKMAGLNKGSIADYIRQHSDVKNAIELWLKDVERLLREDVND